MSKDNLSSHLTKLQEAELISIQKSFVGKIPNTSVSLTTGGLEAINRHWEQLDAMRQNAKKWKPEIEKFV